MPLKAKPIREIMIKDVVTIPYNTPVEDAADLMLKNRVGSLIVMKRHKPVGILTERDFVKLIGTCPPKLYAENHADRFFDSVKIDCHEVADEDT